jgi:2-polyprenyl-6-methoxyphenol hydroxylase-like FAD-dependent oxidoreductase
MSADSSTPVAIVGAGPTGLALALGLARHGVQSVVLEKDSATASHSRAPGVHLRTLEIFQQWGVLEHALAAGHHVRELNFRSARRGRNLFSIDFSELDDEADHAGMLMLEQSETERILLEAVQETNLCEVRFDAETVALAQGKDGVALTVRERGRQTTVESAFVVGCDGAHSFVRTALGLHFAGSTYAIEPMLADVRVEDERDALDWPRLYNRRGGLTTALRIRPGLWRIIRLDHVNPHGPGDVSDEEVRLRTAEVLGTGPVDVLWASRFRIHRRSSPWFRQGRVLLAGDAAHLHSPAGGQGMNAGIHDAHNLAWKLAYALDGGDSDRLLDSYDVERRAAVVGSVTRYTDWLTKIFLQTPSPVRSAAFILQRTALRVGKLRRKLLRRASMIDSDYPASPILEGDDPVAGVRLPNPILRSADGETVRLYDLLPNAPMLIEIAGYRRFRADLPVETVVRIGHGGYEEPAGLLGNLLDGKKGWILVRPDAHVAWARVRLGGMSRAVQKALGRGS